MHAFCDKLAIIHFNQHPDFVDSCIMPISNDLYSVFTKFLAIIIGALLNEKFDLTT